MKLILRPKIELTKEEEKAVKLVRDMLVENETKENDQVDELNMIFLDYIDHFRTDSPFITCVDFLSALLYGAGVEDENGEIVG